MLGELSSDYDNGGDSSSRVSDCVLLSCSPGLVWKKIGYPMSSNESGVETFVDDVLYLDSIYKTK